MEAVISAVFEVLNFGAIMVLVVLGLGVIAGMMGIFNFAHGEFVLLGAYTVYLFHTWTLPIWLGMLAAPVVVAAIALVLERLVIPRIYAGTFAFGAGLAGLAGALVVPVFSLSADLGIRFLIQGFLAVMLGGVGSFEGSVAGAALIGVMSAALPWGVAPVLADVLVFLIAVVLVRVWPRGLTAGRTV